MLHKRVFLTKTGFLLLRYYPITSISLYKSYFFRYFRNFVKPLNKFHIFSEYIDYLANAKTVCTRLYVRRIIEPARQIMNAKVICNFFCLEGFPFTTIHTDKISFINPSPRMAMANLSLPLLYVFPSLTSLLSFLKLSHTPLYRPHMSIQSTPIPLHPLYPSPYPPPHLLSFSRFPLPLYSPYPSPRHYMYFFCLLLCIPLVALYSVLYTHCYVWAKFR